MRRIAFLSGIFIILLAVTACSNQDSEQTSKPTETVIDDDNIESVVDEESTVNKNNDSNNSTTITTDNSNVEPVSEEPKPLKEVELNKEERGKFNIFFSNFSEVKLPPFNRDHIPNGELIRFGFFHNYINVYKRFSIVNSYYQLPAKYVEESVYKYFGVKVKHESVNQHLTYKNDNYYFPVSDGAGRPFSHIDKLFDLGEGNYLAYVNVYKEKRNDVVVLEKGMNYLYKPFEDWDKKYKDQIELIQKIKATIKEVTENGKTRYVLVEYQELHNDNVKFLENEAEVQFNGMSLKELYDKNKIRIKYKVIINDVEYYLIMLDDHFYRNNNFTREYGNGNLVVDTDWKIVSDQNIITKALAIRNANTLFKGYYENLVNGKGNFLLNAYNENSENQKGFLLWTTYVKGVQKLTAGVLTGGTKQSIKTSLQVVGKSILEDFTDPKEWLKVGSLVYVELIMNDTKSYITQLDEFYLKMQKNSKTEITTYEEAFDYINITYNAYLIIDQIRLQKAIDGRADYSTDYLDFAIDYVTGVLSEAIKMSSDIDGSWLKEELIEKGEFLSRAKELIEEGNFIEFATEMQQVSPAFEDYFIGRKYYENRIKEATNPNPEKSFNYQFLNNIKQIY